MGNSKSKKQKSDNDTNITFLNNNFIVRDDKTYIASVSKTSIYQPYIIDELLRLSECPEKYRQLILRIWGSDKNPSLDKQIDIDLLDASGYSYVHIINKDGSYADSSLCYIIA